MQVNYVNYAHAHRAHKNGKTYKLRVQPLIVALFI